MKKLSVLILSAALLLGGCTGGEDYAATVGSKKITADEVKFYLDSVKSQMAGTELSSDEDWETKEIEGRKAIDLAKERALETAIDNVAYIEIAKALDIKLEGEDKTLIKDNKSQFVMQFGTEASYKEFLKTNNITDNFIDMLCESMVYSSKLTGKVLEEQPVTEEDTREYFEENKEDLSAQYRKAKHVLILTKNMDTGAELSAEEQAAAKARAEDILARAKAGEDFDALSAEFSQDPGLATNPDGYVFTDGEMVPEFQNGVDELEAGEFGLVKSDFGYHVLLRLPITHEDVADSIKNAVISARLAEKMDVWEKETETVIEVNDEVMSQI